MTSAGARIPKNWLRISAALLLALFVVAPLATAARGGPLRCCEESSTAPGTVPCQYVAPMPCCASSALPETTNLQAPNPCLAPMLFQPALSSVSIASAPSGGWPNGLVPPPIDPLLQKTTLRL